MAECRLGSFKGNIRQCFKVGVHLTKDPSKVTELCTAMNGNKSCKFYEDLFEKCPKYDKVKQAL